MGVWMNLFVASAPENPLSHEDFAGLVDDLIDKWLVKMPATLFVDEIDVNFPLDIVNRLYQAQSGRDLAPYSGRDREDLLRAVWAAPYGERDLCVCWKQLAWDNEELPARLSERGFANAWVVLYTLAQPQTIYVGDALEGFMSGRQMQFYFTTTGKGGPQDIADTPLEPVLRRRLGANVLVDRRYS
jgi:hypothetical protein